MGRRRAASLRENGTVAEQQRIVGIDLGTTNSLVAFMQGDGPAVIPGEDGSPIVPSVVAFQFDTAQGGEGYAVGNAARAKLVSACRASAVYSAKRLMGRDLDGRSGAGAEAVPVQAWPPDCESRAKCSG